MPSEPPPSGDPATPTKKRGFALRLLISLGRAALICYILWCAGLYFAQERLIFPRHIPAKRVTTGLPEGVREFTLTASDGATVPAWLIMPRGHTDGQKVPVVVWFHGNAEIIDQVVKYGFIKLFLDRGIAVLLPEYRGYGRAGGSPSQTAITADSVMMVDWLRAQPDIDPDRIVYLGRSLGGGVACAVAALRPPRAMILQCTFTSIASFTSRYLVPEWLVKHPFRSDLIVPTLDLPILVLHGNHDTIVPVEHGRALAAMAKHARYFEQNADHLDYPTDTAEYSRNVLDFLKDSGVIPPD